MLCIEANSVMEYPDSPRIALLRWILWIQISAKARASGWTIESPEKGSQTCGQHGALQAFLLCSASAHTGRALTKRLVDPPDQRSSKPNFPRAEALPPSALPLSLKIVVEVYPIHLASSFKLLPATYLFKGLAPHASSPQPDNINPASSWLRFSPSFRDPLTPDRR